MQVLDREQHLLLSGFHNRETGLWHVPLPVDPSPTMPPVPTPYAAPCAARAIGAPATAELVAFAHATLFSPALSTLETALSHGFLTNFPGLSLASLRKFPQKSVAMHKGHMDQTRCNQRSTRTHETTSDTLLLPEDDDLTDIVPSTLNVRTHYCYVNTIAPTGQIYTDQTGKFVTPSTTGNNYLMILYDYDSNAILVQPYANKTKACLLTAYKKLHNRLVRGGLRPKLQRLDNEASNDLKEYMTDEGIDFQLVPPGVHRRNAAERAIRTFANHFIAGLCSTDENFPLHLWDQLIHQAEITLNLMRGSRINPNLSAFAQLNGTFDFNRHPMGPPGTAVLAHEKPTARTTWSPHALEGWYVGPALNSYRCYNVWITDARDTRICDTLEWFPKHVKIPSSSTNDIILAALQDIATALRKPTPASPLAPRTDSQVQALLDLISLLTNVYTPPDSDVQPTPSTPPVLRTLPRVDNRKQSPRVATVPNPRHIHFDPDVHDQPSTRTYPNSKTRRIVSHFIPVTPDTTLAPEEPVLIAPPLPTTYQELTGPRGTRNRRTHRRNLQNNKPTAGVPRRSGRTPKPKLPFVAPTVSSSTTTMEPTLDIPLVAFHGTALNPDTGLVTEYREVSECSTGEKWQNASCDEIGRLFQGLGPDSHMPTGTDTCHFIFRN